MLCGLAKAAVLNCSQRFMICTQAVECGTDGKFYSKFPTFHPNICVYMTIETHKHIFWNLASTKFELHASFPKGDSCNSCIAAFRSGHTCIHVLFFDLVPWYSSFCVSSLDDG